MHWCTVLTQIRKLKEEIRFKEQKIQEYRGCSDVTEIYEAELKPLREQLDQHQHQRHIGAGPTPSKRVRFIGCTLCAHAHMCAYLQLQNVVLEEMKSKIPVETDIADPAVHQTLLGRLITAVEKYPKREWEAAALSMERPPIEDRAVSLAFINEYEQWLKLLMPLCYKELNSYVLQGTKQSDCRCKPEDECSHWHGSATDPSLCKKSWIIRAFTSKTTSCSVIETFMAAAKLTGDNSLCKMPMAGHTLAARRYSLPSCVCTCFYAYTHIHKPNARTHARTRPPGVH